MASKQPPAATRKQGRAVPVTVCGARLPFTAIPNALYGSIDHWEIAVAYSILWHGEREGCYESQARWAERLGMSADRLQKTLSSLIARGLVEVEERHAENGARLSNRYRWVPWELVAPPAPSAADPYRSERHPLPAMPAPPTAESGTPYRSERHKQDSEEQDSEEQDPIPPLPPHPGGHGLTAARSDGDPPGECLALDCAAEQPTAERPTAKRPATQQPSAGALIKPAARKPSPTAQANQSEQARQLIALWNQHKPAGWSALACVSAKRMEVAQAFARDLGGWEAFLQALPVALANAAQDRFWSGPGHDWNSFMGYGQRSDKGHFWRFLEQQQPRTAVTRSDGSMTLADLGQQLKSVPRLF